MLGYFKTISSVIQDSHRLKDAFCLFLGLAPVII